jgi:hypothetical protein
MRSADPVVAQGAMEVPDMPHETPIPAVLLDLRPAVQPTVRSDVLSGVHFDAKFDAQFDARPQPSSSDAFVLFCLVAAPFLVLFMLALTTGR